MGSNSTILSLGISALSLESITTTRPQLIPQSNGQAEVTIRTLKVALKTKLEDLKGKWVEYLPEVLWEYRTTRKSTTQETPFALAFGTEAVDPVEVGLKSPKIELANIEHNEEALRLNLDLLEEKNEQVLKRMEDYHRKTARCYDQRVLKFHFYIIFLIFRVEVSIFNIFL